MSPSPPPPVPPLSPIPTAPAAPSRIAVIGGGAIGGFTAALVHRAGHDVTLCVRTPLETLTVESEGAVFEAPVTVASAPDRVGPADWVLLTTKAQDTAGTAGWLERLCGPETVVAVLQNGLGHEQRVAPLVPEGTGILPTIVYMSVERTAPGRIVHHIASELHVPQGPLAERFAALLAGSGIDVVPEADFATAAWRKLFTNLAANPLTALLQQRMGIFADPGMARLTRDLLREAAEVARAEGADIGEEDVRRTLEIYTLVPPGGGSSMLYDRMAGRPMEHEYLTGAVVRAAERHGIATPLNSMLLTLLRAVDRELRAAGGT
ncbi:2-dehydropantoate 2-reductase [Streptomyces sp. MST-110588]|uniref:2-dehydropantoate 2-reductase n=1 Tax=Streptomyces sp. MST-110588 TaxID=2833628 RepID=UPI001F5D0C52|nr:2-dehydropantoate 2-reductase [Streptomyces sp. MST-110588]UNO41936.1 2-dehydropantoate 2-reductase [Streptomyces sp. MST-110588]